MTWIDFENLCLFPQVGDWVTTRGLNKPLYILDNTLLNIVNKLMDRGAVIEYANERAKR